MVIRRVREASMAAVCLALVIGAMTLSRAQNAPNAPTDASQSAAKSIAQSISAETLYLQLRSVGLDKSRVYRIRETSFDRAAFHFTLDDCTIAFTFFFQAEDGIRYLTVTGVQTCALPI